MRLRVTTATSYFRAAQALGGADQQRYLQKTTEYEEALNRALARPGATVGPKLDELLADARQQGALKQPLMLFLAEAARLATLPTSERRVATQFQAVVRRECGLDEPVDPKATSKAQGSRGGSMLWGATEVRGPRERRAVGPVDGQPVIQGFTWDSAGRAPGQSWWKVVEQNAQRIADAGFAAVWLPPAGAGADVHGYLPHRWYDFNSGYGTALEHSQAVHALNEAGVVPIADVVANHRVGVRDWADFELPKMGAHDVAGDDEWGGARGHPDTGAGFDAGRDLDHTSPNVQKLVTEWVTRMVDLGYGGIRWDYTKGFAPQAVGKYLVDAAATTHRPALTAVGELWGDLDIDNPNAHRQGIVDWIDGTQGTSASFDFTTKGLLQHALSTGELWRLRDADGKPAGVIGWWPERAWTFLDNHDTGPVPAGQGHWAFPGDRVAQGYAYLLTHPGTPTVFWPHFFDWGDELRENILKAAQARKEMGVQAASKVDIEAAEPGLYGAVTHGRAGDLAVKLGPRDWAPPGRGWEVVESGHEFCIWKRARRSAAAA